MQNITKLKDLCVSFNSTNISPTFEKNCHVLANIE